MLEEKSVSQQNTSQKTPPPTWVLILRSSALGQQLKHNFFEIFFLAGNQHALSSLWFYKKKFSLSFLWAWHLPLFAGWGNSQPNWIAESTRHCRLRNEDSHIWLEKTWVMTWLENTSRDSRLKGWDLGLGTQIHHSQSYPRRYYLHNGCHFRSQIKNVWSAYRFGNSPFFLSLL